MNSKFNTKIVHKFRKYTTRAIYMMTEFQIALNKQSSTNKSGHKTLNKHKFTQAHFSKKVKKPLKSK